MREDVQALYGFRTADERGFFTLLLTVNGVGPKVALAIVGSRPVADIQLAILQRDQAVLTAVSGVGKRLAERIILELKEKVAAAGVAAGTAARRGGGRGVGEGDVVAALQALGYSLAEARTASRASVAESLPGPTSRSASRRRFARFFGNKPVQVGPPRAPPAGCLRRFLPGALRDPLDRSGSSSR